METLKLECVGAGEIIISKSPHHLCGGRVGFNFCATWGGSCGGVLPRGEAEKLIAMLQEQLATVTESEEEEYDRFWKEFSIKDKNK